MPNDLDWPCKHCGHLSREHCEYINVSTDPLGIVHTECSLCDCPAFVQPEKETDWRTLQRYLARQVYYGWKHEVEERVAAKKGITIPEDKQSTEACAAYTAIYECMLEHFRQYTDSEWRNF